MLLYVLLVCLTAVKYSKICIYHILPWTPRFPPTPYFYKHYAVNVIFSGRLTRNEPTGSYGMCIFKLSSAV